MSASQKELDHDLQVTEQESVIVPGVADVLDSPTTLPLDQLISMIEIDSLINPEDFIEAFLVPGGGE